MSYLDFYQGRRVLVTGGAGSIGSVVVKKLLSAGVNRVTVLSRDETKQHDLFKATKDDRLRFEIGDIRDRNSVMRAVEGQDVVIHAAAMKHVPACEKNVLEAVRTNVDGAINVHLACLAHRVDTAVIVSTDKAAEPESVMGLTKRVQEKLFTTEWSGQTRYVVTRFGNVLGSRGSAIWTFREQVLQKKPVTLTSADMIRFMMTPKEAAELVLWAGSSSPTHTITVKAMRAAYVMDWIRAVGGLSESVVVIGPRPGEKLTETIFNEDELGRTVIRETEIGKIGIVLNLPPSESQKALVRKEFDIQSNLVGQEEVYNMLEEAGVV